ncbi:MAG: hypothetical protein HY536_00860 [Candidatus Colwellbacteria bacterium]|nr:hypothetical protein [Candidatus Colwellbacteria bacterium]
MQNTLLKQFIFSLFYLALFAGVVYGGYLVLRPASSCFDGKQNQNEEEIDCGGVCASCALKHLVPITADPAVLFASSNGAVSVLLTLKNANATFGANSVSYRIDVLDGTGDVLSSSLQETFVYPSEIKTFVVSGIPVTGTPVLAVPKVLNVSWTEAAAFSRPSVKVSEVSLAPHPSQPYLIATGVVVNGNSFPLSSIALSAMLTDPSGNVASVSSSLVNDVLPFEARAFTITIPNAAGLASDVKLLTVTAAPLR